MYTCAECKNCACDREVKGEIPKNCPMHDTELMTDAFGRYSLEENHEFYVRSSSIEGEGYCQWPRLREVIECCKKMGYRKVGVAFCKGLQSEAAVVTKLLRQHGLEVVSVCCKTGGVSKEEVGIPEEKKIHPGNFEPMCNPIAQAMLLNSQHTEFNIVIGLCVGHDSMFYKYSEALVTTLVAKDRVLAHNPCGAIYLSEGYYKQKLSETLN